MIVIETPKGKYEVDTDDRELAISHVRKHMGVEAKATKFDPEGEAYDYESADKYGITPDETGHYQSREPETGLILKGAKHPTFHKTIKGEEDAGYEIYKGEDGRYYSRPKKGLK